jgi:predicted dehydrogenase
MDAEPEICSANAILTPLGVDQRMEAQLLFPGGIPAQMIADISSPPFRGLLRIEGEKGIVELDNPCLPHKGHSLREWFGDSYREHTLAGGTTYDYQLAAFLAALETGASLPTGGADAVNNMAAVDAIYAAARAGAVAAR